MMKQLLQIKIDSITTEEFVIMIIKRSKGYLNTTREDWSSGYMDFALYKGIVEDYDMINRSNPIERRSAARIAHEVLLVDFGEQDEENWSAAENLKDLYSCHTCVMHIAQMYVKGIMPGHDNNLFDATSGLSRTEATAIVTRIFDKKERVPQTESRELSCSELSPVEAENLMSQDRKAMLIDVRTYEEYRSGHIKGSICIPLKEITNNPFSVNDNKNIPIILYCRRGYQSNAAAQALLNAGFSRIHTIPGIDKYQYTTIF